MSYAALLALQVLINSFNSQGSPDWVEVVNNSQEEVNFNDYLVRDVTGNKIQKEVFIPPLGNCVFDFSNRLNNTGDVIFLYKGEEQIDCVLYEDGNGGECEKVASGSADPKPPSVCYSPTPPPTPKPTDTPTPTPTRSPTPTPTPTKSATPKPTAIPTKKSTATPKPTEAASPAPVPLSDATSTPQVMGLESESNRDANSSTNVPPVAIAMLAGGAAFMGLAGVSFWRARYNSSTAQS